MTVIISRLYDTYSAASRVVSDLEAAGLPHADISLVASNADNWYAGKPAAPKSTKVKIDRNAKGVDDRVEGAEAGAGMGAVVGGGAGLLAGLGLMAIPGIGPVVAAGWLVATALGAVAGGATGGIIGALTQTGISKEDAEIYAEGVRRGGTLVTARVPDGDRSRYEAIMDRSAVKVGDRAAAYRKAGWNRFDPSASPYSAEQARKEREMYTRMSQP
jgi:hypothetical protein